MYEYQNRGEGGKVLIVEDEKDLAELYGLWLNDDFDVDMAHDCTSAFWRFLEPIDVIIVDRNLPDGPGDELVANIRDLGLDCRVVMVTAVEPTVNDLEIDFDDYLCKPISRKELHSTVTRLVDQRNARKTLLEFNQLIKKKEIAETYCQPSELATSERYTALVSRIEELRSIITETD